MAYIFYDTETTGLEAGFDQILQFAALVTDDNLDVVEEVNLRCRLLPYVLPSPGALAITGIRPSDIATAPLSHYQMIRAIRALIEKHAPAVMVGFNSLGYDEGMLRQALYQTLNPVYLTNTSGNTRMDMMRVAHAASQYAPDVLTIPKNAAGQASFKLGLLSAANGLLHDHAHDALSDTFATLELAKLIRAKAPAVWNAMRQMRSKQAVAEFMDEHYLFHFTDMAFGAPSILAARIGVNPESPSEVAVFDVAHDPTPYLDMDVDAIRAQLKASPRLIRIVRSNSQPILIPVGIDPIGLQQADLVTAQGRVLLIQDHAEFRRNIGAALSTRYADREPPQYVEQRIYEGFPSRADAGLMERFHAVPWPERAVILDRIADARIKELGARLIYAEAPEALPPDLRNQFDAWRRERLTASTPVPWCNMTTARQELEQMKADTVEDADGLLADIAAYLDRVGEVVAVSGDQSFKC